MYLNINCPYRSCFYIIKKNDNFNVLHKRLSMVPK